MEAGDNGSIRELGGTSNCASCYGYRGASGNWGIVAAAIGGSEGVKDYADFILDVPLGAGQKKKWKEVVVPAIESEIVEPIATYIDDEVVKPIERKANASYSWADQNIFQPVLRYGQWYWGRDRYNPFTF